MSTGPKLEELCHQLELTDSDHLLEIGTGWGGMAIHAAKHYGCKVTTTTISKEQYAFALEQVKAEGLEDRITVLCEDYRNLQGSFDKLVSVEMIEAVGHAFYSNYFQRCSELSELLVACNRISVLPMEIGCCRALVALGLAANELAELPASLGDCTGLQARANGCVTQSSLS